MSIDAYRKGTPYEMLIRMAHNCPRGMKNGADSAFMANLINAEKGERQYKLGSASQQLEKLKSYLLKAMEKFFKVKVRPEEKTVLYNAVEIIKEAGSSATLLDVIDEVHEIMLKYYRK